VFGDTNKLQSIRIPSSVEKMENFLENSNIINVTISPNNNNFKVENSVIFSKDGKSLIAYPKMKKDTEYTIPSTVAYICPSAFSTNEYLIKVNTNKELKKIRCRSFFLLL